MKLGLRAKILLITVILVMGGLIAVLMTSSRVFGDAYLSSLQSRSTAIGQGLKLQMDRILQLGSRLTTCPVSRSNAAAWRKPMPASI